MKTWIKRTLAGVVGLVAFAAAGLVVGAHLGDRKMARQIDVHVEPVAWRTDEASVTRGRYLFASRGCTDCHGDNGAGKDVINDGKGMHVRAPNITPGPGSAVAGYVEADWDRAIRHGLRRDGTPLLVMPSEDYARLTNDDLASLVAYLRQMPAQQGLPAHIAFPLPVRALYAAGLVMDAAEKIDHALPPAQPVPEGVTAAHGAYVANGCIGCHGATLSGGKIPGAPPEWPAAANLTPGAGSAMPTYRNAAEFTAMLRSGRRPDGSPVSPVMPFGSLKELNDTDVQALYLHLQALPAVPAGQH